MRSLGMESVLVGDVVHGVSDIGLRVDVAEAAADGDALVLLAGVHHLGGLLTGLAVGELEAKLVSVNADVVQWRLLHDHSLVGDVLGCREGDGDDGGEGDDQLHGYIRRFPLSAGSRWTNTS